MIVYIYRILCGYITIKIFGDYPERFLNICAFNHIQLWRIRRRNESIYANISVKDYLLIRKVKKNRNIHIRLIKKKGLYFVLRPYLPRRGIPVGIVLFFGIMVFLSQFVWNIEIVGNKNLNSEEVLDYCANIGIKEGTYVGSVDTNSARLRLLLENANLSWASFIIEGSHLTVNISETKTAEIKDSSPCNLIASRDGVVSKVTVSSGKAVVKSDQAVLKGDLLASGMIEYSNGTTHFASCEGEVLAKTERELQCETPLTIYKTVNTGRVEERRVLCFFGIKIPLSTKPIDFEYIKKESVHRITYGSAYSPISVITMEYIEKQRKAVTMNETEAKEYLQKIINQKENKELQGAEIVSYEDEFSISNRGLMLKRKYSCIENIAQREKIKIINVN